MEAIHFHSDSERSLLTFIFYILLQNRTSTYCQVHDVKTSCLTAGIRITNDVKCASSCDEIDSIDTLFVILREHRNIKEDTEGLKETPWCSG